MTTLATILWGLNLLCVTVGHLSLKAAATVAPGSRILDRWTAMLKDVWVWIGVAAIVPLSLAVLVGSIDTLAVSIGGRIIFGEALTLRRSFSIILIAMGVALVGWG